MQKSSYSLEDISVGDITSGITEARCIDQRHRETSQGVEVYRCADAICLGFQVITHTNVVIVGKEIDELFTGKGQFYTSRELSHSTHCRFSYKCQEMY